MIELPNLIIIQFMSANFLPNFSVGDLLKAGHLYLATAESCSGGLLGHMITNTVGSSDYYLGGFISYANRAKYLFLGVEEKTLQKFGAVSRETVLEMALGARNAFQSQFPPETIIGLATSGIAGPGGGSPQKPVGTVWIGISGAQGEDAFSYHFAGTREEIKYQTALEALRILKSYLEK